MPYILHTKKAISIADQIDLLKRRGLRIDDETLAASFLNRISYFKLSAYLKSFENDPVNHTYPTEIKFEDVIALCSFDSKLRTILFDALEEVELAVKVKLINEVTAATGNNNWYEDYHLFNDTGDFRHKDFISDLYLKLTSPKRREKFIKHYYDKYSDPKHPPIWMIMETLTLGTVSKMYEALNLKKQREEIAWQMINMVDAIFVTWLHHFTYLRNLCAHHSVVWNRVMDVRARFPSTTKNSFIKELDYLMVPEKLRYARIYASLCLLNRTLSVISSNLYFKTQVINLMNEYPNLNIGIMGFTPNWRKEPIWTI